MLLVPEGRRDWPLRFYSAERLFSKEARLGRVEPDLMLPEEAAFGRVAQFARGVSEL
jgi:hypothetical protein